MSDKAYLILENGAVFEGEYFGSRSEVTGEIVFNTGMTGYLETLTDQSYFGQIVLQTFPLIGNYGVISSDFESSSVGAKAYIVKYWCQRPSNFRSEGDIDTFLKSRNIAGICGIDTRELTKIIRQHGIMNGRIKSSQPTADDFEAVKAYKIKNAVENVSCKEIGYNRAENARYTVALFDFGAKENIRRELLARDCNVWTLPYDSPAECIADIKPDGIVLSNGPGDPADVSNEKITENLKKIMTLKIPMFGICLGHQFMAIANGFETYKLKYGHRGANQPVKDLHSGKVYITSQNHGYAVSSENIDANIAEELFINVNDRSCEGIVYKNIPAFSVQFHPEACGGARDTEFLFDRFTERLNCRNVP